MSGNRAVLPVIRLAARSSIPPPAIHPRCTRRYRQFPYQTDTAAASARRLACSSASAGSSSSNLVTITRCRDAVGVGLVEREQVPPHRRVEIAC